MIKKVIFLILAGVIIIALIFTTGCCSIFESLTGGNSNEGQNGTEGESEDNESAVNQKTDNEAPIAVMEIHQQNSGDNYFTTGNPVYLSASDSTDADGNILSYQWQIGDINTLSGEEVYYIFENIGEYNIVLTAHDGIESTAVSRIIYVTEPGEYIIKNSAHEAEVRIEYIITNNGPVEIEDIMYLVEIPQTYQPFQVIKNRESNYKETDDLYTDDYNLIARFNLGNLAVGQSANVYVNCDVILYEYEYADMLYEPGSYYSGDEDLLMYTGSEYYINSDSREIKSTVKTTVGAETDPLVIAEKLYDFVCDNLTYDKERVGREEYGYFYASDILRQEKGVCTDYSILYTALCRAAGIPARFVQGVPVLGILMEGDGQLPYGHAWVEIKLPGYGWVPIDITAESGFMAYNYYLNMETYKGSGVFYKSLDIDGKKFCPIGLHYSWKGSIEPDVKKEVTYSVSGLSLKDIGVIAEEDFLKEVGYILGAYEVAINNNSSLHSEGWTFNDPQEIALEEALLLRLKELSRVLEGTDYPESYTADRNNLIAVSHDINTYKQEQIECMKSVDYSCYDSRHNMFIDAVNALFDCYNNIVDRFNQEY